jgi:hypothetical protein
MYTEILKNSFTKLVNHKQLGIRLAAGYFFTMLLCGFLFHKIGDYGVETDFYWGYVPQAKSISEGKFIIDGFRGPLYPITLYFFEKIFRDYFISGLVIGVLAASISIGFIYELFRISFNRNTAFLASLLIILNPIFVQFTYSNGTDMLFFAFSYITVYFLLKDTFSKKKILFISLFSAAAYLTRYNGVFLLAAVPISIIFLDIWKLNFRERIFYSGSYFFLFLIFISPWSIYTYLNVGDIFYNHNYKNIAYEFWAKGKMGWDVFWFTNSSNFNSLFDVIFYDPIHFIGHLFNNFFTYFFKNIKELVGWHIGLISLLGIILFFFSPRRNIKQKSFVIIAFLFLTILSLTFYSERFALILIPFYVVFSIKFLLEINQITKYKFSAKSGYAVITLLLYISVTWTISYSSRKIDSGPNEILTLSNWYKRNFKSLIAEQTVSARKPHIAFYLGMNFVLLPFAEKYEDFYQKLKKQNVNYVYLSVTELGTRTDLYYLIDKSRNFNGLTAIYYQKDPELILYEVK